MIVYLIHCQNPASWQSFALFHIRVAGRDTTSMPVPVYRKTSIVSVYRETSYVLVYRETNPSCKEEAKSMLSDRK